MNAKVLLAVFKRNFVGYFTSPTGYVFICVFVLLGSVAAFLTDEFFNQNLANLDQLNKWFPFIMLVFVPAITMSVWADERRQGTDELLLTIPAGDFDIVLGKYLAALAIFSVSLVFSLCCNLTVLAFLGSPDWGLLLSTYVGYWLVGMAMLAIGMVASFLTSNLTIAYLLGTLFNAPLVAGTWAGSLFGRDLGQIFKQWSIEWQFADFGRGIVSLSHLMYFVAIAAVMIYLSVAFIGRRHWRTGVSALPSYILYGVQISALLMIGACLCVLTQRRDIRADVTSEQLSSLSSETKKLLDELDPEQPVLIEAFVSDEADVPEGYIQTRMNLLNKLREMDYFGGKNVRLRLNDTMQRFTAEAARAEQRYGVTPRLVRTQQQGTLEESHLFLGVAITRGMEKVTLPFIDRGIPVEYELVRSIATVSQQERKKIGVLTTDAQVFGQANPMMMGQGGRDWLIVDELRKQYEVVQVGADSPIDPTLDALLAVQPSSLGPQQMDNFLAAVRGGIPTAIFEDPFPVFASQAPGTSVPRRPPGGGNPMMGGQAPPKGEIRGLWGMLGIDFSPGPPSMRGGSDDLSVIWQDHNPNPKLRYLPKEFVFVDEGVNVDEPFGLDSPISSDLEHLLFPFPGWIRALESSDLEFTPLVRTGQKGGTVAFQEIMPMMMFGGGLNDDRNQESKEQSFILAAQITGQVAPPLQAVDGDENPVAATEINVVLVADIDLISSQFFAIREQGAVPEAGINFDFDNVTFVLNALDLLADDERFLEIRSRRPKHRTLTRVEEQTAKARKKAAKAREDLQKEFDQTIEDEEAALTTDMEKLQKQMEGRQVPIEDVLRQVAVMQQTRQKRLEVKRKRLKDDLDKQINQSETEKNQEVARVQNRYKFRAVVLPPIPLLLVACVVWFVRRTREREGVSRARLRT